MSKPKAFVLFNNQLIEKNALSFYDVERFRYADACFESMLFVNENIPLLEFHQNRLDKTCDFLQIDSLNISLEHIKELVVAHNLKSTYWRVRFSVVRKEGFNFTPQASSHQTLIECTPISNIFTMKNNIGFYTDMDKPNLPYSKFKTANTLFYVLAMQFAKSNRYDDVLIRNNKQHWIEASSSNLFIIRENKIFTPFQSSGAVIGTCSTFLQKELDVEYVNIDNTFISHVNELFLTNGIQLIQPVRYLNNRPLSSTKTAEIIYQVKETLSF